MTHLSQNVVQEDFRIRSDDTETLNSGSGWEGVQNFNATMGVDTSWRIRIQFAETNGVNYTSDSDLNFSVNGGTYEIVGGQGAGSKAVRMVESGQYTDGDAATDVLTGGSGSFDTGYSQGKEDDATLVGSGNINSEHAEAEWCIEIVGSEVSDTDLIRLRMGSLSGLDNWNAYDNTPVITVDKPAGGGPRRVMVVS